MKQQLSVSIRLGSTGSLELTTSATSKLLQRKFSPQTYRHQLLGNSEFIFNYPSTVKYHNDAGIAACEPGH